MEENWIPKIFNLNLQIKYQLEFSNKLMANVCLNLNSLAIKCERKLNFQKYQIITIFAEYFKFLLKQVFHFLHFVCVQC